jgi:hypothetical protein
MSLDIARCDNSRRTHADLGDVSPNADEKCARVAELRVRFALTIISIAGSGEARGGQAE